MTTAIFTIKEMDATKICIAKNNLAMFGLDVTVEEIEE